MPVPCIRSHSPPDVTTALRQRSNSAVGTAWVMSMQHDEIDNRIYLLTTSYWLETGLPAIQFTV